MNQDAVTEEPKARKYIREWKRRDYEKNPDKIKEKNKRYYYKNKTGLSLEEIDLYGEYLPIVSKIYFNANKLKEVKPELLESILKIFKQPEEEVEEVEV